MTITISKTNLTFASSNAAILNKDGALYPETMSTPHVTSRFSGHKPLETKTNVIDFDAKDTSLMLNQQQSNNQENKHASVRAFSGFFPPVKLKSTSSQDGSVSSRGTSRANSHSRPKSVSIYSSNSLICQFFSKRITKNQVS